MPFIRKLSNFVTLSPEEIRVLNALQSDRVGVRRHREIITEGHSYDHLYILLEGYAIRCQVLRNGGGQVLNVVLPGDLIGFPVTFFQKAQYAVTALTDTVVSPIPHDSLIALLDTHPTLAAKVFWSFATKSAMYVEHLTNIGRRSASERVANFLLELLTRLKLIGMADECSASLMSISVGYGKFTAVPIPDTMSKTWFNTNGDECPRPITLSVGGAYPRRRCARGPRSER